MVIIYASSSATSTSVDLTSAEVWQWLCAAFGGVHAKGAAMAQQSAARRAERAAARAAEAEAEEDYDEAEDEYRDEEDAEEEMETPAFRIGMPDWLNGIRHWGHKVTEEMEAEEPESRHHLRCRRSGRPHYP